MKQMFYKFGDIVEIEWFDSSFNSGVFERAEVEHHKPIHIFTTGFVTEDSKEVITVVTEHYDQEKSFRYIHTIPKVNVIHIWSHGHGHCG